ncbi:polyketide cyclase [Cellulomonas chitinilytica]|uniref:Polyketide cyclase n=1 Tax=Cellulomonas chitinilytica TaxID=398759 RepID=A0A919P1M5_9CELL|nr:nuclear transport factor 2 family protein [Cellulomonas chitinilytica]GIG20492.1 polyketide cyclase [Cellulomonas chitinilytica]
MTLASLQDRLDHLDLVARLGACLDEHRFDDLRALFTDDATVATPGGTADGVDAVVAQATRNHQGYAHLQHRLTDVLVELAGDTGAMRANLAARFATADLETVLELGAVYRLATRRTAGGWRLARLEIVPLWRVGAAPVPVVA